MTDFDDVLAANADFASAFPYADATAPASRHLAVLTCMDSRIDPLRVLGLEVGDAKVLRNAGAQLTDDLLDNLVLSTHVLGVERILVLPHTGCAMASSTNEQIVTRLQDEAGIDTSSTDWHTVADQVATLTADVEAIRSDPRLKPGTVVAGGRYDVETGRIELLVP